MSGKTPKICVLGACNVDFTSHVPCMPRWGETLRGTQFDISYGGKGANQAAIAAKLGAAVSMISKVGADIFGQGIIDNMQGLGINVSHIQKTVDARTGAAHIMVDENGRNAIIVITGANDLVSIADVKSARTLISEADVLLVQWEIPIEVSLKAMEIAKGVGTTVIFNPAPMGSDLPDRVFPLCDLVCLNETEITALTQIPVDDDTQIVAAAQFLIDRGAKSVVVTMGEKGAFFVSPEDSFSIEPYKVQVEDTTGAGDCFCGSYAFFIALGDKKKKALEKASKIASISVQKKGTQASYPVREELKTIFNAKKLDPLSKHL